MSRPPRTSAARALNPWAHAADPSHVRREMGRFPSGVAALCATVEGRRVGMVASSFSTGVSYDPPMVMFSVQESSTTWPELRKAPRIGVSVLGVDQAAACLQLASRRGDRFAGLSVTETDAGALLVDGAATWLDCEVVSTAPAGDHQIVLLQVHATSTELDAVPLVYHGRSFHSLRAIA